MAKIVIKRLRFCVKFRFLCRFIFVLFLVSLALFYFLLVPLRLKSINVNSLYSYYVCSQIYNESEQYLIDWLDHQFNVVGFKNVCLINVGKPLSMSLRKQFRIAYIEKSNRAQEFHYCLSSCFVDKPMNPEDLLMIQDTDEYLNVRKPNVIFKYYYEYDIFHFNEIRYGYVLDTDNKMLNRSLRTTNLWRKPHNYLDEYEDKDLQDLFKCKSYDGLPACKEGKGKEMIRVGTIQSLSVHFHTSKIQPDRKFYVDMKEIRLNHYIMRTKEDAIQFAKKWDKLGSHLGQIAVNQWFRMIFDDSITESKRLI